MRGEASIRCHPRILTARVEPVVLAWLVVAGCTFAAVKPEIASSPPPTPFKTLVLGDVQVTNAEWQRHAPELARGVREWVAENGGFDTVITEPGAVPPADSLVLVGTITEIDKGSAGLRFFVGMGAGQAKAKGDFEIRRPDGAVLAKFTARRSYLGGAGMGGAGLLDMDDLVRRLGRTVAETTRKWMRGEKID